MIGSNMSDEDPFSPPPASLAQRHERERPVPFGRRLPSGCAIISALLVGTVGVGAAQYQGWDITPERRVEKSPLTSSADTVQKGKALFLSHCARCHGPDGKGTGPDSDHAADLTDEFRTDLNPEGVLFYKVWSGHAIQLRNRIDDMPAFEGTLTRDQVWMIVEYLKVLRTPIR
jgi:mono/diheme cytochrome c family protein